MRKRNIIGVLEGLEREIALVKSEEMNAVSFLMDYCDGTFARDMIKDEITDFVDYYYEDTGQYVQDYCDFVEKEWKEEVFGIRFRWEQYHQFEEKIDRAYREFSNS